MNKIVRITFYSFILGIVVFLFLPACLVQKPNAKESVDTVKKIEQPAKVEVDTEFYSMVEKPALFQNGDFNTFRTTFLKTNIKYPINALKKKQQGTVIVSCGIDCFGSLKVFTILKSSGVKVLDNEAIRVLKLSPKWTPASADKKLVGQMCTFQIKFNAKTRSVELK